MTIQEFVQIAQFVGIFIACWAVLVQRGRLNVMRKDLELKTRDFEIKAAQIADSERVRAVKEMSDVLNRLLEILPDVKHVLALQGKDYAQWSKNEDDWKAAYNVCLRFHHIGILVLENLIAEAPLARAWFYSIPTCYKILKPFVEDLQTTRDRRYFSAFKVLAERVEIITKDFEGFDKPPFSDLPLPVSGSSVAVRRAAAG